MSNRVSMATIKRRTTGHWFDPGTMRFFSSRVGQTGWEGPGGTYFVSSEQFDSTSPRLYTVRRQKSGGDIDTVGEFQGYTSRAAADARARHLADHGGADRRKRSTTGRVHVRAHTRRVG